MKIKSLLLNFCFVIFLWTLVCPEGHPIYFTEKKIKDGEIINAKDWFVNNKGFFYKGIYTPMWWSNPIEGQLAICPTDKKMLRFETKYIKRINGK